MVIIAIFFLLLLLRLLPTAALYGSTCLAALSLQLALKMLIYMTLHSLSEIHKPISLAYLVMPVIGHQPMLDAFSG